METSLPVTNRRASLLYAGGAVVLWSTVATAFKLGLQGLSVAGLLFIACGVSLLFFGVFLVATGQTGHLRATTLRDAALSAISGALNPFAYYLILFHAYSLLPAQLAQPLNMIWPVTLALLSVPLLKQKIGWRQFLALIICFGGIVVLSSQGGLSGFSQTSFTGVVLATGSSFFWALYWILNVKDPRPVAVKLFLNFLAGFIYLLIFMIVESGFTFQKGLSLWAALYVGLFETGITYVVWMKAMQFSDNSAVTGSLMYATPFLSLIFISSVLGEKIHFTTLLGLMIIITGILTMQFVSKDGRNKLQDPGH